MYTAMNLRNTSLKTKIYTKCALISYEKQFYGNNYRQRNMQRENN